MIVKLFCISAVPWGIWQMVLLKGRSQLLEPVLSLQVLGMMVFSHSAYHYLSFSAVCTSLGWWNLRNLSCQSNSISSKYFKFKNLLIFYLTGVRSECIHYFLIWKLFVLWSMCMNNLKNNNASDLLLKRWTVYKIGRTLPYSSLLE